MYEVIEPFRSIWNTTGFMGDMVAPGLPTVLSFVFLFLPAMGIGLIACVLFLITALVFICIGAVAAAADTTASLWRHHPEMILLSIAAVLFVHIFIQFYKQAVIHIASWRLPGPWGLPIFGSIHRLYQGSHVGLVFFLEEADKLRRAGETIISFNIFGRIYSIPITASSAKELCESTELLTKGRDYAFIRPWLRNGLLTSDGGSYWKAHRKMITPTFHFSRLNGYIETFRKHSRVLVDLLLEKNGQTVDVYPYLKRCALDIICETTLGMKYSMQTNIEHKYLRAVEEFNSYVQRYSSEIHMWVPPLWFLLHANKVGALLKVLHTFTEMAIQTRIRQRRHGMLGDDDRTAFLDQLLEMWETDQLSMDEVREEVDTFVFAGHDTTSTTLGWLVWCLATNLDWQEKLHQELDDEFPDVDCEPTEDNLKNLPLLDRCIKESMRVYATAPFTERLVKKDTIIGGHTIPAGSEIFLSPMMLHHNRMVYQDDWKFDPDRFLEENVNKRSSFDYVPFSAGPRNCIGQKFAILEIKIVAAILLRSFRVSSTEAMTSNIPAPEVILRPMNGIKVTLHRRD